MNPLAAEVLDLIRPPEDGGDVPAERAHAALMPGAVALLRAAALTQDPILVLDATEQAIASAVQVLVSCEDSSGIIGDTCHDLLVLHPQVVARARPPYPRLVDWMIDFQFSSDHDLTLDPVAYAPTLGDLGLATYRRRLDEQRARLGPRPAEDTLWAAPHAGRWFALDANARRLAVLDRDLPAIIATHARDRQVATWLDDTAAAFEEIGEVDLAIYWARVATEFDHSYQARQAAERWCRLLAHHRPEDLPDARAMVFNRWPPATTAAHRDQPDRTRPHDRDRRRAEPTTNPQDQVRPAPISPNDTPPN